MSNDRRIVSPAGSPISRVRALSALTSPSSSSTPGRNRRAMRRISSSVLRVVSCTCSNSSRVSRGDWSATRLRLSSTAVSDCPTSSCSSCATRRRSDSCADRAIAELYPRSASSRSIMLLNVVISSAISPCPVACSRGPGLSRSIVVIARVSLPSGASPTRISTAFAISITTSPAASTTTSRNGGVDTVAGPNTSRAAAVIRTRALSRKIRPNNDTRAASP